MGGEGKAAATPDQNNQSQPLRSITTFSLKHLIYQTNLQRVSSEKADTPAGCVYVCMWCTGINYIFVSKRLKKGNDTG